MNDSRDDQEAVEADRPGPAAAAPEPAHQVGELEERLLRVQAELENFRKRSRREIDDAQRYREIDVLRDALADFGRLYRRGDTVHDARIRGEQAQRWGLGPPGRYGPSPPY